jgi:hypothetical protein
MIEHKMSGMTKMLIEIAVKKEVKDYLLLNVLIKFSILGEHANTKTIVDEDFIPLSLGLLHRVV